MARTQETNPAKLHPPKPGQDHVLNGLALLLQGARYNRLVIAGGPRAGKTTISEKLVRPGVKLHTSKELENDESILALPKNERWSAASLVASHWFDELGPWVCEGVQMPRALRKWLGRHEFGKPADAVLWLAHPVEHRDTRQHAMALGCETVWKEIRETLRIRGVVLLEAQED